MLKWTLPAGVLLALACSGELPELPGASSEPTESTPSAPQAPSAQPVSTGQDAPPVEAIPAVVRICAHDGVQEMVEGWGQRSSTPAGIARLCQAQYMAWKADLDAILEKHNFSSSSPKVSCTADAFQMLVPEEYELSLT